MYRTKIFYSICLLIAGFQLQAQEFGIELNTGMQGLKYEQSGGDDKLKPGFSIGANYCFFLNGSLGFVTGISFGKYGSVTSLPDGTQSSWQVDNTGSAFEYKILTAGYKEKLDFFTAGIPLMLQYHTQEQTQWYVNVGTKLIFPFSGKLKTAANRLALSGYYPDFNIEVKEMPQHGFGTITNWKQDIKQDLKPTATLSAATGVSFKVSTGMFLYTGLYIDYGISDIKKAGNANQAFFSYSHAGVGRISATGITNNSNARVFAFGLQLRLGLERKERF